MKLKEWQVHQCKYVIWGYGTKIAAAKIATKAGCHMIICNGHFNSPLSKLEIDGTQFSWFSAIEKPLNSRKQWISGALQVKGKITIDKGAPRL